MLRSIGRLGASACTMRSQHPQDDLRRSAVKNLDEAGVSRDVARSISGHKTDAMYTRYNIADVKRKRKALELVQEFREVQASEAAKESNVVAMRK
jgi:hypothetical protein